jgi:hypothetical protein
MKLNIPNGKFVKINHPLLPPPVSTPKMPAPKLILEKKKKP